MLPNSFCRPKGKVEEMKKRKEELLQKLAEFLGCDVKLLAYCSLRVIVYIVQFHIPHFIVNFVPTNGFVSRIKAIGSLHTLFHKMYMYHDPASQGCVLRRRTLLLALLMKMWPNRLMQAAIKSNMDACKLMNWKVKSYDQYNLFLSRVDLQESLGPHQHQGSQWTWIRMKHSP